MKFAAIAAAALVTATSVSANEIGATGITWGVETEAAYTLNDAAGNDVEDFGVKVTPEIGYTMFGIGLTADMDIAVYNNEEFKLDKAFDNPKINFGASYEILGGLELFGETTWDIDGEDAVDTKVGATFNF
tara:strand:- start:1415 stop:1807 length:393 start_codon:yes stop_codon:yes gene_type:complete